MSNQDEVIIEPFFNDDIQDIHPALGTVDGVAYVGVFVPCKISDNKGNVTVKDVLYLVTSERTRIRAQTVPGAMEELSEKNWRLSYKPMHWRAKRWNLIDAQAYLNGATVNPDEVFTEILGLFKKYVELPEEPLYVLHALWTVGTYFHTLFNSYPYLYVGGVKRSGKTKTLTVHSVIDFNAIFSNNMSSASLYRLIQNQRATLLIDESEKLSNPERAQEFRNILLAGYKKGTETYRCGKDKADRIEAEGYAVYGPKAIGNISGLEDVLDDRCISQFQQRTKNKAINNREIELLDPEFAKVRSQLYVLFLTYWKEVQAVYQSMGESSELSELNELSEQANDIEGSQYMTGRELELWKPLFAIARFLDGHTSFASSQSPLGSLGSLMQTLSCRLAAIRHVENVTEVGVENLVQCLLQKVPDDQTAYWVKVKGLKALMEDRFEEKQEWLKTTWIGGALRRLGFTDKRRLGTGYEYNVPSAKLKDVAGRLDVQLEEDSTESQEPETKSCFICRMALPTDHANTTTLEGKEVHVACFKQVHGEASE